MYISLTLSGKGTKEGRQEEDRVRVEKGVGNTEERDCLVTPVWNVKQLYIALLSVESNQGSCCREVFSEYSFQLLLRKKLATKR